MRVLGLFIRYLSRMTERIGGFFFRLTRLLGGLLPVLLPPAELSRLIHDHYEHSYRDASGRYSAEAYGSGLADWEEAVLARFKIASGTMVVLGAGVGRESIEFARRGLRVLGLDISRDALRLADRTAREQAAPVTFIQASFYDIPTLPARVDYMFLSGVMYSAIPGRSARQNWLRRLRTHLKKDGLAVLSYYTDRAKEFRPGQPADTFKSWLASLPGANPAYQPGDLVAHDHFLHTFLSEEELRSELAETGAAIAHLEWDKQFAVLTWPCR